MTPDDARAALDADPWPGFREVEPGVLVRRFRGARADITVHPLDDHPEPPPDPRLDDAWRRIVEHNPRAFNGPILRVHGFTGANDRARLWCTRDEYRRLAVQPALPTGVIQLGVKGITFARDHAGVEHLCLARRGHQTRIYGGLWELAPAGAVDPPPPSEFGPGVAMDGDGLWRQAALELHEELGIDLQGDTLVQPAPPVGLVLDRLANALEAIIPIRLHRPVEELLARSPSPDEAWEYDRVRWIPASDAGRWLERHAGDTIPPTRAVLRWLLP